MNITDVSALSRGARGEASSATTGNSGGTSTTPPNNTLNGNSFITLLTAQLQAQDPMNPMDPSQMVSELVSINSLQQLIEIQQDLSGGAIASTGSTGNASANILSLAQPQTQSQAVAPSPSYHDAVIQQNLFPAQSPASL